MDLHVLISALGDSHGRGIAVWADCGTVRIDVSGDDWRELDDGVAARLISALQEARAEALLQQVIMEAPDA